MRSLRFQLLLSHLLLVLLMGVVMSYAIATFFSLGESIDRVLTGNFKAALAAQEMEHDLSQQSDAMNYMLAGRLDEARREYFVSWPKFKTAYEAAATATDPRQSVPLKQMESLMDSYRKVATNILYVDVPKTRQEAQVRYSQEARPLLQQLEETAHTLVVINQREIIASNEQVKREAHAAAVGSVFVTGAALLMAIALAYVIVRLALAPLARFADQAEAIGTGDLSAHIDLQREDEIGALSKAFNRMAENLQELRKKEERRLHRAERRADAALSSLYDPVVVTDAQGRIVFLNRAAEGLFGPSPAVPRTPIVEHVGDRRIVRAIEKVIKENRAAATEDETSLVPIRVGDRERTYRLRAAPMVDDEGSMLGCVAVLEDISHLRELDRLKNEFIGIASHELRTPVTSLLLATQLLQEGAAGKLTDQQMQIVDAQREDLERLGGLLQELLDMSRLEAGTAPPRFEMVPPVDLISHAVKAVQIKADTKGVRLEQALEPGLPPVRADPNQINRVLVNLMDNAIRHTPAGGEVRARAMTSNNHVTFLVEDTGEGIPSDYLERIFDRFVQVPGATQGGAGLGLAIVQMIVKAHGGEMKVESELHKGSAFSFNLSAAGATAGETTT